MSNLFHHLVFWHDEFDTEAKNIISTIDLTKEGSLSKHIRKRCVDKKHDINLFTLGLIVKKIQLNMIDYDIFEVEVDKGDVVKCVVRCEYDEDRDISIVFRQNFIVTAYLNNKEDSHIGLDVTKYERW